MNERMLLTNPPSVRLHYWITGVALALCFPSGGQAEEARNSSPSKVAESIAGKWTAVPEVQGYFDRLSAAPTSLGGTVEHIHIELMEAEKLIGEFKDLKRGEQRLKKILADANHVVVGAGHFGGSVKDRPLAYLDAYFLLTQCDGETFISALNIDAATTEPWRIHRIPGKKRSDDVLIMEFGPANHNQICAFRREQAVAPTPPAD